MANCAFISVTLCFFFFCLVPCSCLSCDTLIVVWSCHVSCHLLIVYDYCSQVFLVCVFSPHICPVSWSSDECLSRFLFWVSCLAMPLFYIWLCFVETLNLGSQPACLQWIRNNITKGTFASHLTLVLLLHLMLKKLSISLLQSVLLFHLCWPAGGAVYLDKKGMKKSHCCFTQRIVVR